MTDRTPEQHADTVRAALSFQRSVIQSGETWTETCAAVESDALDALARLAADTERLREALREIATATVPAASAHALRFRRIARAALASPPADTEQP